MNLEAMRAVLDRIRQYDRLILFRHLRPDGDCVGASKGLKRILELSYPDKQVILPGGDCPDDLRFLGEDDPEPSEAEYADALGIVVDTGSADRISNPNWARCRELVKIDHHPDRDPYAATSWVEEERSSACEMIAALQTAFSEELKLDRQAATCVYLGMVTDSGRFRYAGVNGETMRLAGAMLDAGVDTERLYDRLYLRAFESYRFQSHAYEQMKISAHGVVSLFVGRDTQERFDLSFEEASAAIGYLDSIRGCLCALAFIDAPDGSVRVRLRSRFVEINGLAERYHGGGHAFASGATVYSKEEAEALLAEADALVGEYKRTHDDWL